MKKFKVLFWTHEELGVVQEPKEIRYTYARSVVEIEKVYIHLGFMKFFTAEGKEIFYPLAQWARIDDEDLGSQK